MAAELGLPGRMGARVIGVTKGSPAEAASCKSATSSCSSTASRSRTTRHLINLVSLIEVGKRVPLVVFRDGKTLTIWAAVGVRDESAPSQ